MILFLFYNISVIWNNSFDGCRFQGEATPDRRSKEKRDQRAGPTQDGGATGSPTLLSVYCGPYEIPPICVLCFS